MVASIQGGNVSLLVEGAAVHSFSCTSAIKLGLMGTPVGTEFVYYSAHLSIPHHPSLHTQESTYTLSYLSTLHRPEPE